jgi:hypothetical protein
MIDNLDFLIDFIRIDILFGFGYYSILFFILKWSSYKKEIILEFDNFASKLIIYIGVIYFILWFLSVFIYYFNYANDIEKNEFTQRLIGKYSFGIWAQPVFWLTITQLLRLKFFKNSLLFRILMSLSFLITFERFVIIITSLHRDYLPSSWSFGFSWFELLLTFPLRIIEFIIVVLICKKTSNFICEFVVKK